MLFCSCVVSQLRCLHWIQSPPSPRSTLEILGGIELAPMTIHWQNTLRMTALSSMLFTCQWCWNIIPRSFTVTWRVNDVNWNMGIGLHAPSTNLTLMRWYIIRLKYSYLLFYFYSKFHYWYTNFLKWSLYVSYLINNTLLYVKLCKQPFWNIYVFAPINYYSSIHVMFHLNSRDLLHLLLSLFTTFSF